MAIIRISSWWVNIFHSPASSPMIFMSQPPLFTVIYRSHGSWSLFFKTSRKATSETLPVGWPHISAGIRAEPSHELVSRHRHIRRYILKSEFELVIRAASGPAAKDRSACSLRIHNKLMVIGTFPTYPWIIHTSRLRFPNSVKISAENTVLPGYSQQMNKQERGLSIRCHCFLKRNDNTVTRGWGQIFGLARSLFSSL